MHLLNMRGLIVSKPRKAERGQSVIEFALTFPILLAFLIGIMEGSRLIYTYLGVYNATREAARYAGAAGRNSDDTPHFTDCPGIQAAAQRGGLTIDLSQVMIKYDQGPDDPRDFDQLPECPYDARLGDRVIIRVQAPFQSPFLPGVKRPFIITSYAARTILRDVELGDEVWP